MCTICFAYPLQNRTIQTEALSELAQALEIPEGSDLIAETQRRWLRKSGLKRTRKTTETEIND